MRKIASKGVKLKEIKKSDLGYFLKWWKDKELVRLTSGVYEKSNKVLEKYFFSMMRSEKDYHFMILFKLKPIGHVGLTHLNKKKFEIQIVIGEKKFWGKGLGVAAIKKALSIAFVKLGYAKACLEVRKSNIRAIRAYETCEFVVIDSKKSGKNKTILLKMILLKGDFLKAKTVFN